MSEKPLLLSPAKSGILLPHAYETAAWLHWAALAFGCAVILVGGVDVVGRIARAVDASGFSLGDSTIGFIAFAPAAAIGDPSMFGTLTPAAHASTSPQIPSRLKVPSIGVDANVEQVGKKADGSMDTPKNFADVGWYSLGSLPGEAGNAVFAGHVNNALTSAGVFAHLSEVKMGDYVTVLSKDGTTLVYMVTQINEYPASEAPAKEIFTTQGPSQLVLITCDGDWVADAHSFDRRLVVVARLVHL
jgi:LPXTG-site transpeptidase (sortase) family protein